MESLNSDIENNNRRLAVIEQSISRALLYDDNQNTPDNKCIKVLKETTLFSIFTCLAVGVIILIVVIIIIILLKISF